MDEETGLYYYGARYYNPRESIFLSFDPMFEETGTPYQYCFKNPVIYTDPTGMTAEGADGGTDWIKNKSGKYLDDKNATNQATTRKGWEYVGKELPKGVDPKGQDILEEDSKGRLVHKNTDDWFNRGWNSVFGSSLPEKKVYDQAEENMLAAVITTAPVGYGAAKVAIKVTNKPDYDYGDYGSNYYENAEKIRKDLGIPEDWIVKPSKKDGGIRFQDPKAPGKNNVRVMPGRPKSAYKNSRKPYTVRYKDGAPVNANGTRISNPTGAKQNKSPNLHVPAKKFKF